MENSCFIITIEFHFNKSTTIQWATPIYPLPYSDYTNIIFIDNGEIEWRNATFTRFIDGYSMHDGIYDELHTR
jgi:hypothetical protein